MVPSVADDAVVTALQDRAGERMEAPYRTSLIAPSAVDLRRTLTNHEGTTGDGNYPRSYLAARAAGRHEADEPYALSYPVL